MTLQERIARLNGDSSVDDFKDIVDEQQNEIYSLNEKFQDILEKSADLNKGMVGGDRGLLGAQKVSKAIHGMWRQARGDASFADKFQSLPSTPSDWSDSAGGWIPGGQKAALGSVLRSDAVTGSYLCPDEVYNDILHLAKQSSVCMGKVTKIPMSVKEVKVPTSVTQVSLAWPTDQTTAKTETNPTFDLTTLTAATCAAWMTWTDEFEEDSAIPVAEWFMARFAEAWGQEVDTQVLAANAAPFTGILHNTNVNDVSLGAGNTSFSDIGWENLIDLEDAVTSETGHQGAGYIMSRYVFNLLRRLKDDNGQPVFMPPTGTTPGSINGKPYTLSEVMPGSADDAVSTSFLIYGNLRHWLMGERIGMDMRVYRDTIRAVDYDQVFLRFRVRAAFDEGLPDAFSKLTTAAE